MGQVHSLDEGLAHAIAQAAVRHEVLVYLALVAGSQRQFGSGGLRPSFWWRRARMTIQVNAE
ncbi:MAG TPA: hypothetical protein DGA22_02890 [Acidobacterium sp.]|nr:hypothetical protein [Acidobacterium sp.]